jgi:integrase
MRPVAQKDARGNDAYQVREHLTEAEMDKLLAALKGNRHGHRDWLIGLVIYRHGLRVSEACDLRWDDIDLRKRTIVVRRLRAVPTAWLPSRTWPYNSLSEMPSRAATSFADNNGVITPTFHTAHCRSSTAHV